MMFAGMTVSALLTMAGLWQEPARQTPPPSEPACVSVSKRKVPPPRKLHDAKPDWAEMSSIRTPVGVLIYDVVIGPEGTVTRVKPYHIRTRRRPDPKLEGLWADAIRKWTFEPTIVDGKPVPVCMTVTVNIDL